MIREFIFDVSKEYPLLARDEIISCFKSEGIQFELIKSNEDVLILKADVSNEIICDIASRVSMSFSIGELLFTSKHSIEFIKEQARSHSIEDKGRLAVQYKNRSDTVESKSFVHAVADVYTASRLVDLSKPDQIIHLLITPNNIFVSEQIVQVDRSVFERRKAHLRPFFSPISLHPKIARALVNLSQVNDQDTILDPFCGTGGILLEAGLMNISIIGSDISEKMVKGTQRNLSEYNINSFNMFICDISDISNHLLNPVDAVVTDFPYGKSTSLQGEPLEELYQRSFHSIQSVLKPGKKAVIGSAIKHIDKHATSGLKHILSYPLRVHQSLTRYFHVFQKAP
ncbi:MAG: methyltransferase domain-containing protein [Candidatus Thermoplasmatota archaeon]|nr:methyltransferase domain-containing protein [Candidatus Thermoplasmatota archaeon]MBS3801674.1 methyltransferase domain-containing protein [Candidatus Thermoplasmatota archaeon]